jgi:MYXO-CTERM domain-containing protein
MTWTIPALALLQVLAVARPRPLPSQAECASYQGTASGNNDPTQLFELRVCPAATGVTATLQSSSLVSGHSLRASEGSWDAAGTTLSLVESRFLDSRPEPGWRFCLIDELKLTKTASGNLEGTYVSQACSDRAELVLQPLVVAAGGESAPVPERVEPERAEPVRVAPPPASPDDSRPAGCTCTSASDPAAGLGWLALAWLAGLAAITRRRRRGTRPRS